MRLPDDYEDHGGGLTPTVISAIVAVTIFVAVILTVVLIMNRQPTSHQQNNTAAQTENVQQAENNQTDKYPDTQDLITGSTLTPSDLDFWDMYPETTATPLPSADPSQKDNKKETAEADPSTDGKHTLVTNRDGKEEWVLISPYLPKHEYDFTKLVCQSDLMKYYQDGKLTSYVGVDISKYQDYVDFLKLKKAGVDFAGITHGMTTAEELKKYPHKKIMSSLEELLEREPLPAAASPRNISVRRIALLLLLFAAFAALFCFLILI